MKHFGNQLDVLFRKKKIRQKDFASELGVSEVTITKWKSQESIDAAKLEVISKILNVPITLWFDESPTINQSISNSKGTAATIYGDAIVGELANMNKEIENLKLLLKEKERTIQILMNKMDIPM